jgi:DNA modification methylase
VSLIRGDALSLPLRDESVDLVVTSPPYFALRSYTDGGEHYDGQIGSEATPAEFVDALVAVTAECVRVLKPSGSIWVNLGDKYAGSGGHNNSGISTNGQNNSTLTGGRKKLTDLHEHEKANKPQATRRSAPDRYNQASDGIRAKSLMGLPWRYAIRCIDDLGLILRAEVIWSKPNGLPESVTDRVRRSHETWFHMTKEPRYFSAVDEIREEHAPQSIARTGRAYDAGDEFSVGQPNTLDPTQFCNPLGKLPGSVRTVATEPLRVPDHLDVDHFAAFPSEWPRWIISGWSPSGICTSCGEGRRPTTDKTPMEWRESPTIEGRTAPGASRKPMSGTMLSPATTTITGESCACPTPDAPTRPAVVLDPFTGTGTTPAVANALGRHGIGVDLSADYLRLARWRCSDDKLRRKVLGLDPAPVEHVGQTSLLDLLAPPAHLEASRP